VRCIICKVQRNLVWLLADNTLSWRCKRKTKVRNYISDSNTCIAVVWRFRWCSNYGRQSVAVSHMSIKCAVPYLQIPSMKICSDNLTTTLRLSTASGKLIFEIIYKIPHIQWLSVITSNTVWPWLIFQWSVRRIIYKVAENKLQLLVRNWNYQQLEQIGALSRGTTHDLLGDRKSVV
jgi:hypothetical protein